MNRTTGNKIVVARLWIAYETGPVGESLSDYVVIQNPLNKERWVITITANTVGRKRA